MNDDLVAIPCPTFEEYPVQPEDQSPSELIDCPYCEKKMWISVKKKNVITVSEALGKDIFIACHRCFIPVMESEGMFGKHTKFTKVKL